MLRIMVIFLLKLWRYWNYWLSLATSKSRWVRPILPSHIRKLCISSFRYVIWSSDFCNGDTSSCLTIYYKIHFIYNPINNHQSSLLTATSFFLTFFGLLLFYYQFCQFTAILCLCLIFCCFRYFCPQRWHNILYFVIVEKSTIPVLFSLLHFLWILLLLLLKHKLSALFFKWLFVILEFHFDELPCQRIEDDFLFKFFCFHKLIFFKQLINSILPWLLI